MADHTLPHVDLVLLTRDSRPLRSEVARAIDQQEGVRLILHRVLGESRPHDRCRWDSIARARNKGKYCGTAPWLMFLDDDVVLGPQCIATLVANLRQRPVFAALAADYRGDHSTGQIARHVAMGATLFRREVLEKVQFTWRDNKCECQCCCDDLRRLHWGIDYLPTAKAHHLPKDPVSSGEPKENASGALESHSRSAIAGDNPSVCLVVCYFGPLPGWIDHYLLSCAFNPSINFLIVTDQTEFPPVPSNVRVKRLSVSEFNTLASQKTGFAIQLQHPRKLCDFKPAYGHLFEDELAGWDYWGYTDLDVIYGDLRRFLSAAKLREFDIYSARKEFLVGHFTLLRNMQRLRTLYQQSADLQRTLQSPDVLSFDECGRQWLRRMRGEPLTKDAACDSMTHIVHRLSAQNEISACFSADVLERPELPISGWRLSWEEGRLRLVQHKREFMYYHFHGFKLRPGYRNPRPLENAVAFRITSQGIHNVVQRGRLRSPASRTAFKPVYREAVPQPILSQQAERNREKREKLPPRILVTFDRQHLTLFQRYFWASFRAAGNLEVVSPVAVGLYPSERRILARTAGMSPLFRTDNGKHVARRRLREFAAITRELPAETPVAYWDAGDVIFQSRLEALWDIVREHPGKLLAVREPSGYPENPAVVQWTETIRDRHARLTAQQTVFHRPFLNSGFLAGTAEALTKYFDTIANWYEISKLRGSGDPGDQLALNVYCHSQPDLWQEISESWNYCLWGRSRRTYFRQQDGRIVDARGVPIHVVHGNAQTLKGIPLLRRRSQAKLLTLPT